MSLAEIENRFAAMEKRIKALEEELLETKELLAISLKRNTVLENAIFSHDSEGDIILDDEDKPVLSIATEKPTYEPEPENVIVPESTLDLKACAVVEHLKESVKPNEFGVYAIDKKILDKFMTEEISEDLRVKEVSRQLKKDIFRRAIELFSDIVYIVTSPSGNKTKFLALKTSVKRTNTNACTRLTGLGIWS